jgi:hypothetical protein
MERLPSGTSSLALLTPAASARTTMVATLPPLPPFAAHANPRRTADGFVTDTVRPPMARRLASRGGSDGWVDARAAVFQVGPARPARAPRCDAARANGAGRQGARPRAAAVIPAGGHPSHRTDGKAAYARAHVCGGWVAVLTRPMPTAAHPHVQGPPADCGLARLWPPRRRRVPPHRPLPPTSVRGLSS